LCCPQLKLLCRLKEVAQAMQYLHARNVVHGDLKVANVLLASCTTAPFGMMAKVTDFGLSRALQVGAGAAVAQHTQHSTAQHSTAQQGFVEQWPASPCGVC
jgi:serine/threonine protein kinase